MSARKTKAATKPQPEPAKPLATDKVSRNLCVPMEIASDSTGGLLAALDEMKYQNSGATVGGWTVAIALVERQLAARAVKVGVALAAGESRTPLEPGVEYDSISVWVHWPESVEILDTDSLGTLMLACHSYERRYRSYQIRHDVVKQLRAEIDRRLAEGRVL